MIVSLRDWALSSCSGVVPLAPFRRAPPRLAPRRSAPVRSAPVRSAPLTSIRRLPLSIRPDSCRNRSTLPFRSGCCHRIWWRNRPALCKSTLGRIFVSEQSGGATSSRGEAPSEYFCWHLHHSPPEVTLHPALSSGLSSGNRWQGAREHLARRPSSLGPAGSHGWCPLLVLPLSVVENSDFSPNRLTAL
jgi:hypothetical protein